MVAVDSRNIDAVGYLADDKTLVVRFNHQRATYAYMRVPAHVHKGLMAAGSPGMYFNDHIRGRYAERQIS